MSAELTKPAEAMLSAVSEAARGLVGESVVQRGLAAAESVKGIVVTSEAEAVSVADAAKQIAEAEAAIKGGTGRIKKALSAIEAVIDSVVAPARRLLGEGDRAARSAHLAWVQEQRRRAAEEEARLRREAEEASRASRQIDEDAPDLEAAPAPTVSTTARGGSGSMHVRTVAQAELVNHHEADPAWLKLSATDAVAAYKRQVALGEEPPLTTKPITWRGCRLWLKETTMLRSV